MTRKEGLDERVRIEKIHITFPVKIRNLADAAVQRMIRGRVEEVLRQGKFTESLKEVGVDADPEVSLVCESSFVKKGN